MTWNRELDRVGDDIAQVKEVQRAFVRHHREVLANRQPGSGNFIPWAGREIAKAIDPAIGAFEPAGAGMVVEELSANAEFDRLGCT